MTTYDLAVNSYASCTPALSERIPEVEPRVGFAPAEAQIVIQIICENHHTEVPCSFWMGLMSGGHHTPSSLLDMPEATSILKAASIQGVVDKEPLMLSDARFVPPRIVYLVPKPPDEKLSRANWIQHNVKTIMSWAPQQIGIYLAPHLTKFDSSHQLLVLILKQFISMNMTRKFFLFTGEHGLHSILNAALRLKNDLSNTSNTPSIAIFH